MPCVPAQFGHVRKYRRSLKSGGQEGGGRGVQLCTNRALALHKSRFGVNDQPVGYGYSTPESLNNSLDAAGTLRSRPILQLCHGYHCTIGAVLVRPRRHGTRIIWHRCRCATRPARVYSASNFSRHHPNVVRPARPSLDRGRDSAPSRRDKVARRRRFRPPLPGQPRGGPGRPSPR